MYFVSQQCSNQMQTVSINMLEKNNIQNIAKYKFGKANVHSDISRQHTQLWA